MTFLLVYRVTVFVPPEHLQRLIDGISAADDLGLGDYQHVLWTSAVGGEQFRPLPGAHPTLGATGALVKAPSVRLEFCIPRDSARLAHVIEHGIRAHHPWEVPAIFVNESQIPLP